MRDACPCSHRFHLHTACVCPFPTPPDPFAVVFTLPTLSTSVKLTSPVTCLLQSLPEVHVPKACHCFPLNHVSSQASSLGLGSRVTCREEDVFPASAVFVSCSTVGCGVSALERSTTDGGSCHSECVRCKRPLVDSQVSAIATGVATFADIAAKPLETRSR